MSGIDLSKEQKGKQNHECLLCMNAVINTFNHLQEQIKNLETEKINLQNELEKIKNNKRK